MQKAVGLEYETRGEGEDLLLIHGSQIAGAFLPLINDPSITERFRVTRYHRRGFAGSDRASPPFSIEAQAADAKALMAHLGIHQAHVVGHSYGAVTALQLALAEPDAVKTLVLLEPPILGPDEASAILEAFGPIIEAYASGNAKGAVDMFMSFVCGNNWRAEVEAVVPGGPERAEADIATFFDVEMPALPEWTFDEEVAARLRAPTLFVLGAESAPMFGAAQQRFASLVPRAENATLARMNHLMQMRDSNLVGQTIADFVGRQN